MTTTVDYQLESSEKKKIELINQVPSLPGNIFIHNHC